MTKTRVPALPVVFLLALWVAPGAPAAGPLTDSRVEPIVSEALAVNQGVTVTEAWVASPAPAGSTVSVFLSLSNPTMYDVYVVSASADAAESVELREPDGAGGSRTAAALTATAYGALELTEAGPHLRLTNLTRPLEPGDTVAIVLATDGGERLKVDAVVK